MPRLSPAIVTFGLAGLTISTMIAVIMTLLFGGEFTAHAWWIIVGWFVGSSLWLAFDAFRHRKADRLIAEAFRKGFTTGDDDAV